MKKIISISLIFLPLFAFAAEPIQLTVLDNGLTLYTKEDHTRPLISLFSIVDGGSRTETPDIAGLSHFYEHLIARGGSKKQAETEYRRQMMLLGESHIYTYDDGTAYGFTVPKENFDEALWRLADFMMDLIPDTAGIRKERTIVSEELYMSYTDSPWGSCYEQLMKTAFTEHPYYPITIGLEEVIRSTTLEKLKTFYEERYVPNQIVMAVVGDFETDEMIARIEEQYGHYPPGKISFELGKVEPPQTDFRQAVKEMDVTAAYVMLGYKIPPTAHPDMPVIRVLSKVLGEESNSRLQKALLQDQKLVYSIGSYTDFLRDASLLTVYFQCDPESLDAAIGKVFAEAQRLVVAEGNIRDVFEAREKLVADDIQAKETYRGQAENICHYHIRKAPSLAEHFIPLVRTVQPMDVRDAAATYLNPVTASLSLVVPKGTEVKDYAKLAGAYDFGFGDVTREVEEAKTEYLKLKNGLTLIMREDHASPTFCVKAFVRGGQWLEPEGQAGVADLTADLLDRGTENYSRDELQERLAQLGVELNAAAFEDYIRIEFSGLLYGLYEGLGLLDQVLFHPVFREDEFEKAKSNQLQGIKAVEDQPWEYTHREALEDLYSKSTYRNLVIGEGEAVENLTVDDVKAYYENAFVPANVIVAAAGDFYSEEIVNRMKELWDDMPGEKARKIALIADKPARSVKRRLVTKQKDQNTFNISFLTVSVDHPDFLPLVLAKRILNTRLFFKYIYDKGMAYRMWTRMHPRMGQARFYFEMGVSDENFPIATEGILSDLSSFLKNPIPDEDLETAKKDEITRNRMTYQTNAGVAEGLGYWEAVGLGYDFFEEFPDRIGKISARQVEKAAKKYLGVDRYQLVNVGTAEVE